MDNIDYQRASRIRKSSLSNLLTEQLKYEKSIGGAIRKSISLKIMARMKGIKEKFDPLNIAKFMTFGSRLGPTLVGKLTGRSVKDIEYFAGRLNIAGPTTNKAEKLKMLSREQDISSGGINAALLKIYNLMEMSRKEDIRRKQLEKNHEEENQLNEDRRHKELLNALKGLSGKPVSVTEKVQDEESFVDKLLKFLGLGKDSLKHLAKFGPALLKLIGIGGTIGAGIWLVSKALQYLANVSPNYKYVTPDEAAAVLEDYYKTGDDRYIKQYGGEQKLKEKIEKEPLAARALLKEYQSPDLTPERKEEIQKIFRSMGGESTVRKVAETPVSIPVKPTSTESDKTSSGATATPVPSASTHTVSPEENVMGSIGSTSGEKIKPLVMDKISPRPPETGSGARAKEWDRKFKDKYNTDGTPKSLSLSPKATPLPESPLGKTLDSVQTNNLEQKLSSKLTSDSASEVTKITNNMTRVETKKNAMSSLSHLAVRNQEETFQRMIFESTRVV